MTPAATAAASTAPAAKSGGPLAELVACLEDEYSALLEEDFERLATVLARKEQLVARLAALPAAAVGSAQGKRLPAPGPLVQAVERLRDLNGRNAQALAPRAAGNRARLHFLQSALGRGALYGADGSVQAGPQQYRRTGPGGA